MSNFLGWFFPVFKGKKLIRFFFKNYCSVHIIKLYKMKVRKHTKNIEDLVIRLRIGQMITINPTKGTFILWLKVSLFQNVLLVPSFPPKNQRNFFKNFGPNL